nr:unnamed protein product [Digitaria exilis]
MTSICKIDLLPPTGGERRRRLPRPFMEVEAPRETPWLIAGVGTMIVMPTHSRKKKKDYAVFSDSDSSIPDGILPIVDVRSRAINFGPAVADDLIDRPIFFPVADDELYALDITGGGFAMLSLKPLLDNDDDYYRHGGEEWTWSSWNLPTPPFRTMCVVSYAMHPDGTTILVSAVATSPELVVTSGGGGGHLRLRHEEG